MQSNLFKLNYLGYVYTFFINEYEFVKMYKFTFIFCCSIVKWFKKQSCHCWSQHQLEDIYVNEPAAPIFQTSHPYKSRLGIIMPTVVSKFLEKGGRAFETHKSYIHGAVIATVLATYGYKVAYPLLDSFINKPNKEALTLNNNLVTNNNVQQKVNVKNNNKKVKSRFKNSIPNLNLAFILQFIKLVRIMIPSFFCTEIALLSGHTTFLFLRTFLSIYVANLEGSIVKYIVKKEPQNFIRQLGKWFAVAIPATFINSMIR